MHIKQIQQTPGLGCIRGMTSNNRIHMSIGAEPALYQLPTCERIFKLELIVSNKTYPGGLFKLEFSFSIEMMQASLS